MVNFFFIIVPVGADVRYILYKKISRCFTDPDPYDVGNMQLSWIWICIPNT